MRLGNAQADANYANLKDFLAGLSVLFSLLLSCNSIISVLFEFMGQAIAFDTHAYVKKIEAVGFTEEQAETLASTQAELIDERLATKHDIMLVKQDIKSLRLLLNVI